MQCRIPTGEYASKKSIDICMLCVPSTKAVETQLRAAGYVGEWLTVCACMRHCHDRFITPITLHMYYDCTKVRYPLLLCVLIVRLSPASTWRLEEVLTVWHRSYPFLCVCVYSCNIESPHYDMVSMIGCWILSYAREKYTWWIVRTAVDVLEHLGVRISTGCRSQAVQNRINYNPCEEK